MTFISRSFLVVSLGCASATAPLSAQTKTSPTPKTPGNFSGDLSYRAGGVRLDANARGPARVRLPELDASAQAIALDFGAGNKVSQVRANGSVNFKLDLAPRVGSGGNSGGAPAHIEATCDSAVLTASDRKLVLKGHLNGFYQIAGGAKNTLSGDGATLFYQDQNLVADLTGGVTLRVSAATLGRPDDVGDILITAQRAHIDQADGSATFAGNARAVSAGGTGGANAFDVAAPRFTLTRNADSTLAALKTQGRTLIKLDLPPDPTSDSTPTKLTPTKLTPTAPDSAVKGASTPAKPGADSIGKPTHVEVAADGANVEFATSTATFEGNVKGFYRLNQNGAPQNFDFAGSKAVIRYVVVPNGDKLAGLNVQVSDAIVDGPAFDLGF